MSMPASFAASAGLAAAGAASLSIAPKRQKILAVVPLLFAAQQAIEGLQWIYLNRGYVCEAAGYGFLFFALLVWPVLIPSIAYIIDKQRRHVMRFFVWIGAAVSAWFAYKLLSTQLDIQAIGRHIFYDPPGPFRWRPDFLLYIAATVGATLASSRKAFQALGVVSLALAAASIVISNATAASVWCLFEACLSACIFLILRYHWLDDAKAGA